MDIQILIEVVGTFGTFGVVIYLLFHNLNVNKEKDRYNQDLNTRFVELTKQSVKAIENSNAVVQNNTEVVGRLQATLSEKVYDILRDKKT